MRGRLLSCGLATLVILVLSGATDPITALQASAKANAPLQNVDRLDEHASPEVFRRTGGTPQPADNPSSPQWGALGGAPEGPLAPIGFLLDDGYAESATGFGDYAHNTNYAAIWLNGFSVPDSVPYPLTLTGMQIAFPGFGACQCRYMRIRLVIYLDADRDGNPSNALLLYQSPQTTTVADWDTFQLFPLNLVVNTRGDLYVGWEDLWSENGHIPFQYVAGTDESHPRHRSWIISNFTHFSPNIDNLADNEFKALLDTINPGNLMVRLLADSYTPTTPSPTNTPLPTSTPRPTNTPPPPRCPGEHFTDVCPGDYFYEPVLSLNDAGIISGYYSAPPCLSPDHIPCYFPYNNVTRGQTSKIVSLAVGFTEPVSGQLFEDVPPGSTFYTYIQRLADRGIVNGYPCGYIGEPCVPPANLPYFRPNSSVTRGQLSKMTSDAFGYGEQIGGQTFEDVPPGLGFHDYIERIAARAIINGYPCGGAGMPCIPPGNRPYFRPNNPVTRGQTAKIIYIARSLVAPTPTVMLTAMPTSTSTQTPVPTPSNTPVETETALPTDTSTATGTATEVPATTSTVTPTETSPAETSPD